MPCRLALLLVTGLATSAVAASPRPARPNAKKNGSTPGLFSEEPQWSVGAQIGNYGATGISAEGVDVFGGTVDAGIGLAYGTIAVYGDYLWVLGQDYKLRHYTKQGYNALRGQVSLFGGAGGQLDFGPGLSVRFPAGIQYTMQREPLSFFGGLALIYGRFLSDAETGIQAWFNLGARVLL